MRQISRTEIRGWAPGWDNARWICFLEFVVTGHTGYGLYAGLSYVNQHPGQETIAGLLTSLTLLSTGPFIGAPAYRVGIVNFQFNYSYQRAQDPVCEASRCGARHGALAQHRRAGCDDPGYSHGYDRDRGFVAQRARGA